MWYRIAGTIRSIFGEKRMQKFSRQFSVAVAALMLVISGCATNPNNKDIMSVLGGAVGAVVGSQVGGGKGNTIMTVIGGVAGYVVGGNLGSKMDEADQARAAQVASRRFNDPRPGTYRESWEARDRTPVQTVVVTQPMQAVQGRQCREFTQETTIRIGGKPEAATTQGVACFEYSPQNPQGGWVIQK